VLRIQLMIGICSLLFFLITFELIRKRHLREEYSILWLVTSFIIAVLSLWPGLIPIFTKITGLYYLSAIVGIIFVFLILVLMHYSVVISRLKDGNKELIQRYALLEFRLRELEREKEKERS
jgi:hypothetical protein